MIILHKNKTNETLKSPRKRDINKSNTPTNTPYNWPQLNSFRLNSVYFNKTNFR